MEGVECKGGLIVTEDGKLVCRDTGEVVKEQIITGNPEWRSYSDGIKGGVQRAGTRVTYTTHHQGTQIDYVRHGRPEAHWRIERRNRIRRRIVRFSVSKARKEDRHIIDMLTRLKRAVTILEIPVTAHETASKIVSHYASNHRATSERDKNAIIAAAIHRAVMVHNLSVPMNRIIEVLGVTEKDLWRAKKKLVDSGSMSLAMIPRDSDRQIKRVATFITKITSKMGLPQIVAVTALDFVRTVMQNKKTLVGKKPEIVAAASVYLVARLYGYEQVTQKAVASIVDAKDSNVRKIYRYLIDDMVVLVVFSRPEEGPGKA